MRGAASFPLRFFPRVKKFDSAQNEDFPRVQTVRLYFDGHALDYYPTKS